MEGADGASARSSVNRSRQADGGSAGSTGAADCRDGALAAGRGRGSGTTCAAARSQLVISTTNVARSLIAGMFARTAILSSPGRLLSVYSTLGAT
jgi:hypothetical protein